MPVSSSAELLREQEQRWQAGDRVPVELLLVERADLRLNAEELLSLIHNEMVLRKVRGERIDFADYERRFPAFSGELRRQGEVDALLEALGTSDGNSTRACSNSPLPETQNAASTLPAQAGNIVAAD